MNEHNAKKFFFEMDDIFNEVGLRYFLFLGTLLGAVREQRFIPIDRDFDIGVLQEEFACKRRELYNLFKKRGFSPKYKIPNLRSKKNKISTGLKIYKGKTDLKLEERRLHCDICCFVKHNKSRYYQRDGSTLLLVYPDRIIENLKEIDFYGRKINVSLYAEEFLELTYGKDWRTPHTKFKAESGTRSQIRPDKDHSFWHKDKK